MIQKKTIIQIAAQTDIGNVRNHNEDNYLVSPNLASDDWLFNNQVQLELGPLGAVFIVADGMGGHDSGEVASMLAVKVMCEESRRRELSETPDLDALEIVVEESFQTANNHIKDSADAKGTDMGTTMVCLMVIEEPALKGDGVVRTGFLANVGDSRGYLMRDGALHQISRDHSLVQKMVERGKITANPFDVAIKVFYLSNPIARASQLMAELSANAAARAAAPLAAE